MKNCLLCGVGGQGTVLASRIIADCVMKNNQNVRTAETIGMAQRGGSVVSHVRIGDDILSPLIGPGEADVLLAFEPGEAVRNLSYLKKDGMVIVCNKAVNPIISFGNNKDYNGNDVIKYLKENIKNCFVVDVDKIISECKSEKVVNVALVGVLVKKVNCIFSKRDIEDVLKSKIKAAFLDMNLKALNGEYVI